MPRDSSFAEARGQRGGGGGAEWRRQRLQVLRQLASRLGFGIRQFRRNSAYLFASDDTRFTSVLYDVLDDIALAIEHEGRSMETSPDHVRKQAPMLVALASRTTAKAANGGSGAGSEGLVVRDLMDECQTFDIYTDSEHSSFDSGGVGDMVDQAARTEEQDRHSRGTADKAFKSEATQTSASQVSDAEVQTVATMDNTVVLYGAMDAVDVGFQKLAENVASSLVSLDASLRGVEELRDTATEGGTAPVEAAGRDPCHEWGSVDSEQHVVREFAVRANIALIKLHFSALELLDISLECPGLDPCELAKWPGLLQEDPETHNSFLGAAAWASSSLEIFEPFIGDMADASEPELLDAVYDMGFRDRWSKHDALEFFEELLGSRCGSSLLETVVGYATTML